MSNLSDAELCDALRPFLPKFDISDAAFVANLINNTGRLGYATDKMRYWLEKMLIKGQGGEPAERVKTKVGDLEGLSALFDRARKHLKAPAIVIGFDANGEIPEPKKDDCGQPLPPPPLTVIRLNVAGPRARVPGSVNVLTNNRWGENTWFGRILASGEFEASPRDPTPEGLVKGLQRFAAAPAETAAKYGSLIGKCCFCNKTLTDPRSTSVGYGPDCAKAYGLAWGARASGADLFGGEAA